MGFSEGKTGKTINNIFSVINNTSHRGVLVMLPLHEGPEGTNVSPPDPGRAHQRHCSLSETLSPVFSQLSLILGVLSSFVRDPVGMLTQATASVASLLD